MVAIEEIKAASSFKEWLTDLPEEQRSNVAMSLAVRAALRVQPILWRQVAPSRENAELTALPILRVIFVSTVAVLQRTQDQDDLAAAVLSASVAIDLSDWNYDSEVSAAAEAASCAGTAVSGPDSLFASERTMDASGEASMGTLTDKLWTQIRTDLSTGIDAEQIWSHPLWNEGNRFTEEWSIIRSKWQAAGMPWDFFANWYEDILNGRKLDKVLLNSIARIKPENWEGEDAPGNLAYEILKRGGTAQSRDIKNHPTAVQKLYGDVHDLIGRKEALEQQIGDLSVRLRQQQEDNLRLRQSHEKIEQDVALKAKVLGDQYKELEQNLNDRLEAAVTSTAAERQVQRLTDLWDEKIGEHRTAKNWAFWIYFISLSIVCVGVVSLGWWVFSYPDIFEALTMPRRCLENINVQNCDGFSFKGVLFSGGVLTLITLSLWFVRIKMKEYIAERHLMLDARERKAFAASFIELLAVPELGDVMKDNSDIILHAMFRHGSDGIIFEDGGLDPSISAVASRVLSK